MKTKDSREGKLLYGIYENICVIKALGNVSYRIGVSFDTFISRVLADNTIEDFLIDLTEADYIDSTNLGLLARIQAFAMDRFDRQPTLISANDTIKGILGSLGFDRLFTILDASSPELTKLSELPQESADPSRVEDVLISAHRYLMNTSRESAVVFKDIVEMFEKDAQERPRPN